MIKQFLITALLLATSPMAFAGESPWSEIAPGTRMRLIASDIITNGKTLAAIELDMPQTTKTYWRIPGETGIPVQLELEGSANIGSGEIIWPYPERQLDKGYIDFIYSGPVVLPIALSVGEGPAAIKANIMLGVCDDICVPVRADLALNIDPTTPDRGQDLRIRQALADAPVAWTGDETIIGDVVFDAGTRTLEIAIDTTRLDPQSLIVDNGDPSLLFSMPQKSPEAAIVSFKLLGKSTRLDLHGQPVRLTFLTEEGAFEVSRTVQVRGY